MDPTQRGGSDGSGWSDERIELFLGNLLRTGVILAAAVILVGGGFYLYRHDGEVADYRAFRGEPADLRTPGGIAEDALALEARGIMQLGLLMLIATPVLRVAFSVFAFTRQRDGLYALVSTVVLAVLVFSLCFGGP